MRFPKDLTLVYRQIETDFTYLAGTFPTYVLDTCPDTKYQSTDTIIQGEYAYHQSVIDNARAAEKAQPGRQIAIALDTKGPVCVHHRGELNKEMDAEHVKRKSGPETPLVMPISPSQLAPS